MQPKSNDHTEVIFIKNMACHSCKLFLTEKLESLGLIVKNISLGKAEIVHPEKSVSIELIDALLKKYGFELTHSREDRIVDEIKIAIIELIHHLNNADSIVRKSDYMVEKLGFSYQYLSKIFSEHEHQTIEKYTIQQKMERIKHLIDNDELTLTEIAYLMDYSSVQYLSNQFKAVTGITVSQYKESDRSSKKPIDLL